MTIKQQGGIFGRNPSFNDTEANDLIVNDTLGVGAGTPAANAKAHISRASSGASVLSGTTLALESTGDVILDMLSPADGRALIVFGNASSSQRGDLLYDHSADTLRVRVGNTTQATFNTSGLAFPNGKGIDFSATSGTGTSELFDDYEEGIHTTTLTPNSGSITLSTSYDTLSYTKVGGIVHVWGQVRVASVSSPSGYAILSMPFTAATGSQRSNRSAAATWTYNLSSAQDELLGILYNGTDELRLAEGILHAGDFSGKIQATSQIAVSVTYTVA